MVKRQFPWGLWHRCRHCGTVFNSKEELHEHLGTHKFNSNTPPTPQSSNAELIQESAPLARPYRRADQHGFASR